MKSFWPTSLNVRIAFGNSSWVGLMGVALLVLFFGAAKCGLEHWRDMK
jgi:hypothetical protein